MYACVCLFVSGSKKHFFQKIDFRVLDVKKRVFRVKKRFFEKIRLLRSPPGGTGRGQKNIFLKISIVIDFRAPDVTKSVFRVKKRCF
jgi:hypothetical protein